MKDKKNVTKSEQKLSWTITVLIACLCIPIVFIIGIVLGVIIDVNLQYQISWSSWISTLSTTIIASLTIILAVETWRLRRIQQSQIEGLQKEAIRPNVELYLLPSAVSFQLYDIYIENDGNGSAKNISFSISKGSEDDSPNKILDELNNLNMIKNGIRLLGRGQKRKSHLFNFIEMPSGIFNSFINISIEYEDIEGRKYQSESVIDFSEYKGILEVGKNPIYEISNHLEKIKNFFEGAKGARTKRIQIDAYLTPDREEEVKKLEELKEKAQSKKC